MKINSLRILKMCNAVNQAENSVWDFWLLIDYRQRHCCQLTTKLRLNFRWSIEINLGLKIHVVN